MNADRAGRLEDTQKRLKALIFPYDDVDMDAILEKLCIKPFIVRYSVDGKNYIQIINWDKHQSPHHTEKLSTIPSPPLNPPLKIKIKINEHGVKEPLKARALTVKRQSPTLQQVTEYCLERKSSVDPEVFYHHYESSGWIKGNGQAVKNWKSTIITWEKKNKPVETKSVERPFGAFDT